MGAPKVAPKASPRKKSTTLQHLIDLDSKINGDNFHFPSTAAAAGSINGGLKVSPSCESETDELVSVISYCSGYVFTFTDPSESPSRQDIKRHKLSQLHSIIRSSKGRPPVDDQVLSSLVSMLSANLFRPLPPPSYSCVASDSLPDDESPAMAFAPAWLHLHIAYDVLAALVVNSEPKALRKHLDRAFLSNLLSLFQSEDPRERDRLKNVYHQIYSTLTFHRSFMRKSMSNVFLHFVFETQQHQQQRQYCGVGELLEIWGSIINGFTVPLKEEHKLFLTRVLIPLHKPRGLHLYHRQLTYCVCQFVQKEPGLGEAAVKGILRYWPITNCQKEVLLIGELEELVENTDARQLVKLALPLCSQISKCLNSCNSQVAERALYVWNNEQFVRMASQSMEEVLPAIVQGIEENIKRHWSESVWQLTISVKKMLEEMDPRLYSKCLQELDRRESAAGREEVERREKWERLEMAAASNLQSLQQSNCIT